MHSKNFPTDSISAELIFKKYVNFKENVIYLTEEVTDYVAKFIDDIMTDYNKKIHFNISF